MTPGPLDDYRKKRDFGATPEPAPGEERGRGAPVFVVHRHDATRLHYDLRLEVGGVLCSFAVPKGFSYDPADKHLALRTEDHPLEYEDFHGVIPAGEYGAGTMTIWDRGHFRFVRVEGVGDPHDPADAGLPSPFDVGEVKLVLFGRRLRGEWHLVRTKQGPNTWLLFKTRDRYAGSGRDSVLGIDLGAAPERALPARARRMEVGSERAPFSDPDWMFEARFEGRRLLVEKSEKGVRLRGLRRRLPELEEALLAVGAERALLDGILVATDARERPSAALLEDRLRAGETAELVLYLFDLLFFEDYDLRGLPLVDRKAGLRAILPPSPRVLYLDHVPGQGEELLTAVEAAGLAGVVAKRAGSTYVAGASPDWALVRSRGVGERAPEEPVTRALAARGVAADGARRVKLTNLDKVYWPETGFTKGDLIRYYESVADVLVPYLADRPVHLNRFPDGIEGKSFYQKEVKEGTPPWVRTAVLPSRSREEGELEYMVCDDRETLLHLANLGSIDLHPWMSRLAAPDEPDFLVIDLDPKEAPFGDVIEIARRTGEVLRAVGLRPLLKTSGKTGLHVVLPLAAGYVYDQAALFAEGVARVVARELPAIATVERVIGNREGKVYVDFGQNRRGQTVVPPYVVRPVRGATVSCPLDWEELTDDLRPTLFTIQTVPPRLERRGDLFAPLFEDRQGLEEAIDRLGEYLRGG